MVAGVVIVGGGQGGFQLAASLRDEGYLEPVTIVCDEPVPPYQRPPLSKSYLLGTTTAERLQLRPQTFYQAQKIELITGERVTEIDRHGCQVRMSSGNTLGYDHLVLATGGRNRTIQLQGAALDGVCYLRTLAEADAIAQRIGAAKSVVVVGAGFIGLELAAVCSKLGKTVHVVESMQRCMSRAVTTTISSFYEKQHAEWGVSILLNTALESIAGEGGQVRSARTMDGQTLPADIVIVGVGVEPNDELARASGLPTDRGVVVDRFLLTNDENISAIGDCALFPTADDSRLVRLESVQNATDQARCVAKRLVGRATPYVAVPWFWSDQRDIKLQMVGLTAGCDRTVVRGDTNDGNFSVFCFRRNRLIAVESINRPADHMFGRRLLTAGRSITQEQAIDFRFDLKSALASP